MSHYFAAFAIDVGLSLDFAATAAQQVNSAIDFVDWVRLWLVLRYEIEYVCANGPFDKSLQKRSLLFRSIGWNCKNFDIIKITFSTFMTYMTLRNAKKIKKSVTYFCHLIQKIYLTFSPEWITKCNVSCSLRLNAFKQTVQTKGRSELWDCLCRVRWSLRFSAALQMSQMNLKLKWYWL